ncbi:hypothetical protein PV682_39060 [Streptomyces niveiscabiei]|uniref:hypothetical protein n=1 Tax=Streptomyces niveiscabiei TaxID=164115 RepID=UPI0029A51979|nr:hypothetical protein [Streptomyces niveiscabiei]MDX3387402.1 hypothetical protein [Streptomyces niveiscabiei]
MSALGPEELRREAAAIATWAETRQAPGLPGPDGREPDHGSQETGVGNTYGGDGRELPGLGPLSDFGSWQSVAATILRRTEESAGFDPSSTVFDPFAWAQFVSRFQEMPFLTDVIGPDSKSASISSLSP